MTEFLLVLFTFVIALFTVLVFLTYERIEWLTGAMETHSALTMRLQAQHQNVELVWWDLSVEGFPTTAKHGEPFKIEKIYCGMPVHQRAQKPTIRKRLLSIWKRLLYGPTAVTGQGTNGKVPG